MPTPLHTYNSTHLQPRTPDHIQAVLEAKHRAPVRIVGGDGVRGVVYDMICNACYKRGCTHWLCDQCYERINSVEYSYDKSKEAKSRE